MSLRLAVLLISACLTVATLPAQQQSPAPVIPHIDLVRREGTSPVYRIPALAVTKRGTLIAAYDRRPTMNDLPSNIALVVRRSRDGGRSWLAPQLVRSDSAPLGFGDPSLLVDRGTGRIFLFHAASVRQGFFGATTGNREDDPDVLQADYSWSDDDGVTWQHRRITAQIKRPEWAGLFASSGAGIQLQRGPHAGRLVQQYVVRMAGANYGASAFSDDHGATWRMGALLGPGIDENKVVELADGTLLLNSRAKPFRKVARSTDGGESWHDLHDEPALIDPGNNGAIIRFDAGARPGSARADWLLFSNTESRDRREHLVVKISCDGGATWLHRIVVEPGAAAYSTLTILKDDDIGVLYERGDYQAITFARLPAREATYRCGMTR
jgi:sialidase-1